MLCSAGDQVEFIAFGVGETDPSVVVVAKGADLPGSEVGESIGFGVDVDGFEVEV
jgi:hypothetical protein